MNEIKYFKVQVLAEEKIQNIYCFAPNYIKAVEYVKRQFDFKPDDEILGVEYVEHSN